MYSYVDLTATVLNCRLPTTRHGGPTKHRTDRTGREIAAGKAQINCCDPVINLYTAYHALHNESSHKLNSTGRSLLTTDGWFQFFYGSGTVIFSVLSSSFG